MRRLLPEPPSSWVWLLCIFTVASFVEGVSLSHLIVFIPLHLPELGVAIKDVARVTGLVVAISSAVGIPFVPFWGALADRYARQMQGYEHNQVGERRALTVNVTGVDEVSVVTVNADVQVAWLTLGKMMVSEDAKCGKQKGQQKQYGRQTNYD